MLHVGGWRTTRRHPLLKNTRLKLNCLSFAVCTHMQNWIECRVNVKPNATNRCIRITIYPKCYIDTIPNFVLDINGTNIHCRPVKARSKVNVLGVRWSDEQNEKCRLFIAFDNKGMHQNFSKYFKELINLHSTDSRAANTAHGKWILMANIEWQQVIVVAVGMLFFLFCLNKWFIREHHFNRFLRFHSSMHPSAHRNIHIGSICAHQMSNQITHVQRSSENGLELMPPSKRNIINTNYAWIKYIKQLWRCYCTIPAGQSKQSFSQIFRRVNRLAQVNPLWRNKS